VLVVGIFATEWIAWGLDRFLVVTIPACPSQTSVVLRCKEQAKAGRAECYVPTLCGKALQRMGHPSGFWWGERATARADAGPSMRMTILLVGDGECRCKSKGKGKGNSKGKGKGKGKGEGNSKARATATTTADPPLREG
jgi:hypothetical protein